MTNKKNHMRSLEIIFDDGGGITVQCARFVHSYEDPKQAAEDVKGLLAGDDPATWDGHTPGDRIHYTADQIRNGGYEVMDSGDLKEAIAATEPIRPSGHARTAFLVALTGREIED